MTDIYQKAEVMNSFMRVILPMVLVSGVLLPVLGIFVDNPLWWVIAIPFSILLNVIDSVLRKK